MSSIESLSIALVQQAPDLDPKTIEELRMALWAVGSPLALAIARIYELVDMDVVDPAIALPELAEACATVVAGIEGRVDARGLEAARYRVDTLQPTPDKPAAISAPDVPLTSLKKR